MKRNLNIDIVRAIAILSVLIYHIFAITGVKLFQNDFLDTYISYGGEYGVAIFFILSGFGIYSSLSRKKDNFNYFDYIKKRLVRILPQYYICLAFLLLFTGSAVYLNKSQIYNLFSHFFLFHDQYPSAAGAINGVCWTLGVIFQFYLIAPFLYKCIEKFPKLTVLVSFIISLGIKMFLFHFIFNVQNSPQSYYFNFGKEIYTSLDTFVLGMLLSKIITNPENNKKIVLNLLGLIIGFALFTAWLFVDIKRVSIFGTVNTGVYSDCLESYLWHSVLGIILSIMIYFFAKIKINYEKNIWKFFLFIAKYEYGIFIWHLVLIINLNTNFAFANKLFVEKRRLIYLLYTVLSIGVGVIMSELIDNINYKEIFNRLKGAFSNIAKCLAILIIGFIVCKSILLVPQIAKYATKIKNNEVEYVTDAVSIAENISSKIPENSKYIYLDTEPTAYQYFYELRYLTSPRESVHFYDYDIVVNKSDVTSIFNYINELDVDYVVIRDCPILEEYFNNDYDEKNASIFKKNNNAKGIDELLIKV